MVVAPSRPAQAGFVANVIGASIFLTMGAVQLSVRSDFPVSISLSGAELTELVADRVHFGLDVAWDVYFAVGLALFAISAFRHPRFGRTLGASGLALALALVVVNLATFPDPPAAVGWLDVGPFAAIWYLVVTARVFASLRWAEERL